MEGESGEQVGDELESVTSLRTNIMRPSKNDLS